MNPGTRHYVFTTMARIIGIDLGTTNAAAAYRTDTGPELIPNAMGERLTPWIVGMDPLLPPTSLTGA